MVLPDLSLKVTRNEIKCLRQFNVLNSRSYVLLAVMSEIISHGMHSLTILNVEVLGPYVAPFILFILITVLQDHVVLQYNIPSSSTLICRFLGVPLV